MGLLRACMPGFPVVFTIFAWFASIWSNFACNSVIYYPNPDTDLNTITLPIGVTPEMLPDPLPNIEVGLWGYRGLAVHQNFYGDIVISDYCNGFPDNVNVDAKWKTAQAFSVIAIVFGFVGMVLSFTAPFADLSGKNLKKLAVFYMFVVLCQGLTFLQLSSDLCSYQFGSQMVYKDDCEMSAGMKTNIAVVVLYFCAGLACCFVPPREDDAFAVTSDSPDTKKRAAEEKEALTSAGEGQVAADKQDASEGA